MAAGFTSESAMVLLDPNVEILALPDRVGFTVRRDLSLQAVLPAAGNDHFPVGLAAVDDNAVWSTMLAQGFAQKRLAAGRSRCSLNQNSAVPDTVDGAI